MRLRNRTEPVQSEQPIDRSRRSRVDAGRRSCPEERPCTRSADAASCSSGTTPDAAGPETGERYDDVIAFWVASEDDMQALLADDSFPFFTTPHFDGHLSVLVRGCRIGELEVEEMSEIVADAWLARASKAAARKWLAEWGLEADR